MLGQSKGTLRDFFNLSSSQCWICQTNHLLIILYIFCWYTANLASISVNFPDEILSSSVISVFFITLMRKFDIFLNILRQISCNENYQHWTCCIRCLLLPPVLSTPSMVALATLFYIVSYCKDSFSFADTGQFQLEELSKRQNCSIVCIKLNLTHFSFVSSMWRKQR